MTGVTSPVLGEGADDADLVDDVAPVLVVVIGAREAHDIPTIAMSLLGSTPLSLRNKETAESPSKLPSWTRSRMYR